jgi:AraC family transcriptional regulator
MSPVEKALWYVESHLRQEISLADIAANTGVSRHHLLRAFGAATGVSVMRYVRGRRLTEAAHRLADGAGDILEVAVDAGYNSHEAFTRAFGEQFGMTPAQVRSRGSVGQLSLVQPIALDAAPLDIESPCFETLDVLLIAGLNHRYNGLEESAGVPGQWERFAAEQSHIRCRVGSTAYGVCFNLDDEGSMDYLCGVQVTAFGAQPAQTACLRIARRKYAVFVHCEHIAGIRRTWDSIWNGWLPRSGHMAADAPLLERYEDALQPQTGRGSFSLLIPLA